jgi:hypothetical protein
MCASLRLAEWRFVHLSMLQLKNTLENNQITKTTPDQMLHNANDETTLTHPPLTHAYY